MLSKKDPSRKYGRREGPDTDFIQVAVPSLESFLTITSVSFIFRDRGLVEQSI